VLIAVWTAAQLPVKTGEDQQPVRRRPVRHVAEVDHREAGPGDLCLHVIAKLGRLRLGLRNRVRHAARGVDGNDDVRRTG
jgi:hypothetical protein